MIRAADLAGSAHWPTTPAAPHARGADASGPWFDAATDPRLTIDALAASRGLGVDGHARIVLAHLCGQPATDPLQRFAADAPATR